jgi:hypothetical protein
LAFARALRRGLLGGTGALDDQDLLRAARWRDGHDLRSMFQVASSRMLWPMRAPVRSASRPMSAFRPVDRDRRWDPSTAVRS